MKPGEGAATPVLPAPPGVVRRRTQTTNAPPPQQSGAVKHVGTPLPQRLPGMMMAPRSEPVGPRDVERVRTQSGWQMKRAGPAQQQDLISTSDSWSMSAEREEMFRREIEAKVRAEVEAEEAMRREIEQKVREEMTLQLQEEAKMREQIERQLREEMEEQMRLEQEAHRQQVEERLRREVELQMLRELGAAPPLSAPSPTPPRLGGGPGGGRVKGHARKHSVTNSAREMRAIPKPKPSADVLPGGGRRPLPPPPPPAPLSREAVAAIQIQSCVRRWLAKRMLKRLRRRVAAVREILTTEEQYVAKLRNFQAVFLTAMRDAESQGLLNPSDLASIVGNWDDVVTYNAELLRLLRARLASFCAVHTVGDIFMGMRHFSPIYAAFLSGYDASMQAVSWHQKNNAPLSKIIRACEKQLGNTIEAFLILPVQRIPRYVLLLRAVVHETSADHPDHALCRQAADKMEAVGTAVNERRRAYEAEEQRQTQLKTLTGQIAGLKVGLLDDGRQVVRGPSEVTLFEDGQKRARFYVLFNDAFLLLEPFKSPGLTKVLRAIRFRLVPPGLVPLREAHVTDVTDGAGFLGVTAWCSLLLQWGPANCHSFYLFCKTLEEKTALLGSLEEHIASSRRNAGLD